MTAVRKFLFDTDFSEPDPPTPAEKAAEEAAAAAAEEEPSDESVVEEIVPTFSQEEVDAARETGFTAGREEGVREAAEATERHIADAVTLIGERVEGLFAAHMEAVDKIQTSAIVVVSALARKVLPAFSEREGLGEIERLASTILHRLRVEPRVVFIVNDTLRDAVNERLANLPETRTFAGTVEVVGDPNVATGDCRIEWADGGAERNAAEMLADIERIIAQNVDEISTSQFVVPDLTDTDVRDEIETDEEATVEPSIDGDTHEPASPEEAPATPVDAPVSPEEETEPSNPDDGDENTT
ncbi:MAG: hypothetical protein ISR47_01440 [Rhodospirillales bacterium]|nr:hypothetical protein [Rhodospirillales bacterium]